jgi:hypothetical protein
MSPRAISLGEKYMPELPPPIILNPSIGKRVETPAPSITPRRPPTRPTIAELKNIPGLLPQNMGQRPDLQNASENFSQDFKNKSEMRPEMMNNRSQPPEMMNNGSQPPEMMNNRSQPGGLDATMNGSERPGPRHSGMEGRNI